MTQAQVCEQELLSMSSSGRRKKAVQATSVTPYRKRAVSSSSDSDNVETQVEKPSVKSAKAVSSTSTTSGRKKRKPQKSAPENADTTPQLPSWELTLSEKTTLQVLSE
jgi:hypothetical protein